MDLCLVPDWNKDWKPGPYPQTPEERAAAAKKYGLLPEDYEPFPDNHDTSRGDYPNLPDIGATARDPEESYDFPYLRRNYGEPVRPPLSLASALPLLRCGARN